MLQFLIPPSCKIMSESLLLPLVHRVAGKAADALVVNMTSMCGLDDDRQLLERHLLAIECKLANTEERSETNVYVKSWMKELKSVTYEASDVLDDFQYEALLRQSKISGSTSRKLLSYITHRIPLFFRLEMSKKLKNVLKKINKLVVEMNKFGLESSVHRVEQQLPWRQMHFNLDNSTKIFGRDDDKEVLVKLLLDQQDQQKVRVLPIVGMGGIGKTTLAKMVYNDQQVQQHFQLKMWHCVSDNFDAIALVKSIIELATNRSCDLPDSIEPLQERLEQVIGRIRFLLVLDDVWNEDKRMWEDALKPLLCSVGGPGSVIVVTCRSKQVASIMCTVEPHEVVFLSQEDSWELFSNKAFSHGVEEQAELVSIGRRIVNKCGGLPLALKTMGGLLSSKQQVQEWKAIEKSNIWDSHGGNEVMHILKLSYRHLSSEMKQCFAFCAVFPKDYEIEKDRLIQLWMANGLIQEEGTMDLTQKGEFIFNQLVLMSFLQDKKVVVKSAVYTVYGDNTQYETIVCKMHDLMHDLAKDVTDECSSIEELTQQKTLLKDVCHMQMSKAELEQIRVLCKGRTNLRTLLVPSESYEDRYNFWSRLHKDVKDLLQESASLRALHCSPSSIVICKAIHAKHLRYLDLSGSDIVALPDSICVLYNLQTLRLIDCKELRQLSKDMAGLRKLMHLYLSGCDRLESMSPNFGLLNSLYILTTFVVDTGDGLGIEQLKGLQHLSNRLELLNLKKIKSGENAKEANLNQKQNLSELLFSWDQEIDDGPKNMAYNVEEVLQCLEPHSNIQKLEIRGYGGLEISQWMRKPHMFNYLRELKISNCPRCKSIPVVWLSVSLELLSLQKMDNLTTLCNSLDVVSGGITPVQIFPRLKRMMLIELRSLEIWAENSVGEPADSLVTFPMVEELRIENCPKLASIPVTPIVSELTIVGVHSTIVDLVFMNIRLGSWPFLISLTLGSPEEIPMLPLDAQQSQSQRSLEKLKHLALEGPSSLVTSSDLSRSHLMPWKCFPFVEELAIQRCSNLVRWPTEGLRCLNRLRSLYISRCENLEGNTSSFEETLPLSLEYLTISDCNSVAKLPSNLGNLAKLRSLDVIGCRGLKGLPDGMGGLTSLRELVIVDCPAMEKFPHGLLERLPALEHLGIFACPELKRRCREGGEYFHLVSSVPLIIFDDDSHENPSCEVTRYTQERLGQYIRKPPRYEGGNDRTVRGGLNSKRPLITEASTEYAVKQSGSQEQDGNNIVLEETTSSNVSRLFDVSIEDVGEVRETGGPVSALLDAKRPLITEASAESAAKQSGGQERDGNNIVLEETTSPNISTLFDVSIEDIVDLRETGGPISASLDAKRPIVTEASAEFAAKQSGGQNRDGNNIVLEETTSSNISTLFDVSIEDVGKVRETGGLISASRGAKRPLIIEASTGCAVEQSGALERDRNNTVLEEARILTSSNISTLLDGSVSVSLSAMRALGAKLDMLLLAPPQGCCSKSVKDGMQLLREDIEEISSYLDELSELEEPPPTAKCWMNEAHDLSYDIEDYIDSLLFVQPAESSNNIKGTRSRLKLSGHAKTSKRLKPRHEGTAGRVSQFSLFVQKAIERHQRYDLHSCSNLRRRFVSLGPMLPMQYGEETTHIVIDGRMNEFINSVENDEGKQFKVMSVHGSSGLGKTTLARALYNKVGKSFQCRAFIRVSEQPDTKRIFHDMLSQLQRQHPTPDCKETGLIDNIKTHLQDKR